MIRINTRGVGGSTPGADPADYSLDAYVEDLELLRRCLDLASVVLYGHSHGGFVAARYAAKYPDRLKALIIDGTPLRHTQLPDSMESMFFDWESYGQRYVQEALAESHEAGGDYFFEEEWASLNLSAEAQAISAPTLIIVGERDPIASDHAPEFVKLLPRGELEIIPNAGHFAWVENPSAYSAAVLGFLSRISPL